MTIAGCLLMMAVLLRFPQDAAQAARDAIRVWGLSVVPSLFPYMVFCRTLAASLSQTKLPAAPGVMLLGLLGGSPSGAAATSEYAARGKLSSRDIRALAALTGGISPMFLLHTIRPWVRSDALCVKITLSSLLGALGAFALYRKGARRPPLQSRVKPEPPAQAQRFCASPRREDPITQSVSSILGVGGCIVFFSVLSCGVQRLLPALPSIVHALIHAALEISGGLFALSQLSLPARAAALLYAAAAAFGGFSVLFQNLLFLRPHGVAFRQLLASCALRALLSALSMLFLIRF